MRFASQNACRARRVPFGSVASLFFGARARRRAREVGPRGARDSMREAGRTRGDSPAWPSSPGTSGCGAVCN